MDQQQRERLMAELEAIAQRINQMPDRYVWMMGRERGDLDLEISRLEQAAEIWEAYARDYRRLAGIARRLQLDSIA